MSHFQYHVLKWLPIFCQIELRSVASMFRYYHQEGCLLLYLPILYGQQHSYQTHCREYFDSVDLQTPKDIFVLQLPPGGTLYLHLYMIVAISIL